MLLHLILHTLLESFWNPGNNIIYIIVYFVLETRSFACFKEMYFYN